MSLGIIARCDAGGLGSISREVFRHLQPARTLLLDLGERGRGDCAWTAYDVEGSRQTVYPTPFEGGVPDRAVEWLCSEGITTLFSAETFYDDKILTAARHAGIRTACYAMPELAPWATTAPELARSSARPELFVPTSWRAYTLPDATLLPMPIARDRLPYRARTKVEHLFHVTGKAMCDRNGTELLLRALPFVRNECRLTIRDETGYTRAPNTARVEVHVDESRHVDYWDGYPDDIDLLVMPRRYGGLCLPIQECASLGVPSIVLAADPYSTDAFTYWVETKEPPRVQRMKGGNVAVFEADPRRIAEAIDLLIENPAEVERMSGLANLWADFKSWDTQRGVWCAALDADCDTLAA